MTFSWVSRAVALFAVCFSILVPLNASAQTEEDFDDEFEQPAPRPQPRRAQPAQQPAEQPARRRAPGNDDELDMESAPPARPRNQPATQPVDDFEDEPETPATPPRATGDDDMEEPATSAAPANPANATAAASLRRRHQFVLHNTILGPVGGIHVLDANSGPAGSFRVGLTADFFSAGSFLRPGDQNDNIGGTVSLSWTPWDFLELYLGIANRANANNLENPPLFQSLGDTTFGIKGFYSVVPWLTVGGDLSFTFLNSVGDIGLVFGSTSFGLRANVAADFRELTNPIPLIARLNLQYYFDNSAGLIGDVEHRRYLNLPADKRSERDEDRHLLSRIERFGLNINRVDTFRIDFGVEAPIEVMPDFHINPIAEMLIGIPVNRQNYSCLFIPAAMGSSTPAPGQDGCLEKQGGASFPLNLTLGVRVLPPVPGLSLTLAFDIGVSGTGTFVRELAGNAPYRVIFQVAYAYDTYKPPAPPPEVREVERRVELRIPAPPRGKVRGTIIEQGTGAAVAHAVIAFPGREVSDIRTAADGRFVSYEFDPGEVQVAVSHPEYNGGTCTATIPAPPADAMRPVEVAAGAPAPAAANIDVELRCELVALPRVGSVNGRVTNADGGNPVANAKVDVTGAAARTVNTDAFGNFAIADLAPGTYTARVEAEGYFISQQTFEVRPREVSAPNIGLILRPRNASVIVRAREIVIRRQINFATDSDVIEASSFALMTEIADVLSRNAQISKIEIQGHTDNRGNAERNLDLSQRRADSVRRWLIEHGVAAERLEAKGYGQTRPLVPNITNTNRARNRRVQFMIATQ